jgi:uncharacterized repeat protein (TIGR03803 family)
MNKPIHVRLVKARVCRLIIAGLFFSWSGFAFNAGAQTLTPLWQFTGGNDGVDPDAPLIQARDGSFYGTTFDGAIFGTGPGTIFRVNPAGGLTNLHTFVGSDGTESLGLIQALDGNLYGTTPDGGSNGVGSVFRLGLDGSFTNIYCFAGTTNGSNPSSPLVQGTDGYLYGTTSLGGTYGDGIVFRISLAGGFTNLYSFTTGRGDGYGAFAQNLVQGRDGYFYGMTFYGGNTNGSGSGTIFRIGADGSFSNLWTFTGGSDGANPYAGLSVGGDGNFYGTTDEGGAHQLGTVFRISPSGVFTSLWSFTGGDDGSLPETGLVQGSDGNFYGVAALGALGHGTIFRMTPSGSLTNVYTFTNGSDGAVPSFTLVQGVDGSFFGTADYGGDNGYGTVFKLSVPLNPPANQISSIHILGSNHVVAVPSVAGETYQLQFSSSMNPTNWVNVPGVSVTNSIGALLTVTNFGGAVGSQGFYRFDITP